MGYMTEFYQKEKTNWVRTELKIEQVLAVFNDNPHASLRSVSRLEGCCHQGQ